MPRIDHRGANDLTVDPNQPTYHPLTDALVRHMGGKTTPEERVVPVADLQIAPEFRAPEEHVQLMVGDYRSARRLRRASLGRPGGKGERWGGTGAPAPGRSVPEAWRPGRGAPSANGYRGRTDRADNCPYRPYRLGSVPPRRRPRSGRGPPRALRSSRTRRPRKRPIPRIGAPTRHRAAQALRCRVAGVAGGGVMVHRLSQPRRWAIQFVFLDQPAAMR